MVIVVGASSLGAEIAAARLMAPWFGASTIVWANTIATVLVSLSAGYLVGGRFADRDPTPEGLSKLVLLAAVLLAIVPFVSGPFLRTSVSALDNVSAGAFVGSLLGVLVLIAAPIMLLGAVSPYAIRLRVTTVRDAGAVAGRLYALSTLGSLAGVFLAALVLVPFLGTRRTFLCFAAALALVGALGLRRLAVAVVPLLLVGLIAVPVGTIKTSSTGRVIWERESEYQYARVVQTDDGLRRLELNEGQAVHSVYSPGEWLTGNYWDEMLVLPFTVQAGRPPRSVAVLGNAAGTTARAYNHFFPQTIVDGVEIDRALSGVGRRFFGLRPSPRLRLHTADARPFLRRNRGKWDLIIVDAYRQPYVPFYLSTVEFFRLVSDRLNPGGSVIVNVGHPDGSDGLEKVLSATLSRVFGSVLRDPSQPVNTMLLASHAVASSALLTRAARAPGTLPPPLRPIARATSARLAAKLDGGQVYTDDVAPVEWLVDASIVQVAAEGHR
ncbi:fused MFS/spermidine synthase [Paraconexibacter antarcticus]|uniref:Fused MFS/spermidine synthase n=1 Tax=Paraconexibacter antarcticus TaxID=2949664 RepID=A0ABY5DR10_9ACTN|nr:fused MFS/spermidine synthase [Paraconexibacter antarcticus]UTI63344.1 fused MFS/spermidine synthase [Paraconexibacter antarcticus]